jgi:hypothetical protein
VLLKDEDRFRLVYGPYEPPLFKGGFLKDAVRGKVKFGKYSNAPIPWPIFKKEGRRGSGGHVLCGDLVRALKQESAAAISYHWGVCAGTVLKWRRALGFKGLTPGARRMIEIGVDLCKLPQSQTKLTAAARNRVISPEGLESVRQSIRQRWEQKFAARLAFHRRTGRFPKTGSSDPWIPAEEQLLTKHSTRELRAILGRTGQAIKSHRRKLNIRLAPTNRPWQATEIKLLGTDGDVAIAHRLKRSVTAVKSKRNCLHIPVFRVART